MKVVLALLMLLAAIPTALAQEVPVEVSADSFELDDQAKHATFTGNVVITRETLTIWANQVVITYGAGGQTDIDSLTASGNVRIKMPDQEATGGQVTYNPDTQIVRLSENVVVSNAQGKLSGPELVIDLKTNQSTFKGGSSGRVTGVFTPQ